MKIVVAGAGYAGTLAANRLAKKVPGAEITVINPRADFVERVRLHQHVAGTGKVATPLARMLRVGVAARLAAVEKVRLRLGAAGSGGAVSSDLTLWAVLGSIPDLAGRSGLEVDERGRAVVDEHLRSVSDPRIFVVGDCAAPGPPARPRDRRAPTPPTRWPA